jgi:hypothetical protein
MGVRISDRPRGTNVIPFYRSDLLRPNPATGAAASSIEPLLTDAPLPEPVQLYGLTVLAFLLHTPTPGICRCVRCGTAWPCDHLRLAYRLREGF